jgi:glycosyltransferase involved in cell wall biosynthesis
MIDLTVIILTKNEAHHLPRAINSLRGLPRRIVVVDSGSTDGTQAIARRMGAEVWDHPWRNYASQFNWALAALGREAGGS